MSILRTLVKSLLFPRRRRVASWDAERFLRGTSSVYWPPVDPHFRHRRHNHHQSRHRHFAANLRNSSRIAIDTRKTDHWDATPKRWRNFQRKCRLLDLLQDLHHHHPRQRHFITARPGIPRTNRRQRTTASRYMPIERGPKETRRSLKTLLRTNAPERSRPEPISRRNPGGLQDTALYCSAFAGRVIRIEQSQKSWRTIGGLGRPGEDALDIEPMRPLPQNAVSFWPTVVVEGVVVLDEEGAVLVSWSSSPSGSLRSVDVSGWPACEPGPVVRIITGPLAYDGLCWSKK